MRALVKTVPGKGNLELRDVPVPVPEVDEVLLESPLVFRLRLNVPV